MSYKIKITPSKTTRLHTVDFNNLAFGRTFSDHMFITDYVDGKWIHPRIVPFQDIPMHPASMVLHYGQAIFEGMKASKNIKGQALLFRPELHARRLNASAQRICMPEIPEELFLEGLRQLVGIDEAWIPSAEGSALYIRPFMIATDEFIGVRPSDTYSFMIITCPVGPYYSRPVKLKAETKYVRAVAGGTGEAKVAGNYAASLLPAKMAQKEGYDQVLWLDGHEFKYAEEVGTMNIFFDMRGKVVTPATTGSILKGITRECAITILRDHGYTVEERPVSMQEVLEAHHKGELKEVFGAGTAAVVSQVSDISIYGNDLKLSLPDGSFASDLIKSTINGIRAGILPDKYGWTEVVKKVMLGQEV